MLTGRAQGDRMRLTDQPDTDRSHFVWAAGEPHHRRNQFVRFERHFSLSVLPPALRLHLFADTRYRLRVNGEFVASGPARFVTSHPEYDSHDLRPYLQAGENIIAVEVNFYGASSYQTMPDGAPGFMAGGGNDDLDLSTPGTWIAYRSKAWRWDAPKFSFAQGPVEICDTRCVDHGKRAPLIRGQGPNAPWGPWQPCPVPPPPFTPHRPRTLELAGALADTERRIGFMTNGPDPETTEGATSPPRPCTAFATWIWSTCKQSTVFSAFWSDLFLNGRQIFLDSHSTRGNHGKIYLDLEAGWNLLVGHIEILSEFWPYCLGIPHESNLTLHARRDRGCVEALAIAPPAPRGQINLPTLDDDTPPPEWHSHNGNPYELTPARLMSWDEPAPGARRKLNPACLAEAGSIDDRAATWCFSFAGEFHGHIVAEVEAPAGSILDIACDDWQRSDGGLALYQSNPFTDAADRYLLRGGRQTVEGFHVRGGKLIQVTLRVPPGSPPARLTLHDLWVRSRQTLGPDQTRFTCSLPEAQWAWPVALRTLRVSTDDAYTDCPWRERGTYIGDTMVAINLHALYDPDLRVAARVLRQFAQAQLPDGQLACCAPAWLRKPHEDFTLLWLLALRDYVLLTDDINLARSLWPTVNRIWNSPSWEHHASGLWNAENQRLFIDWGVRPEERTGQANAVLNLLRVAAGQACAELARQIGHPHQPYTDDAASTQQALFTHLWHDQENRLRPSHSANTAALHANILALAFEVGTTKQRAAMLSYVEPMLKHNLTRGIQLGQFSGHLELFYLFFALPAMARNGRPDLAEQLIRDHYGYLKTQGDDTLPECFCRLKQAGGSRCHSWSGAAAIYAARYMLGLRPAEGRDAGHLLLHPIVHTIDHASGRIAHARGWIEVEWERNGHSFVAWVNAPDGVTIHAGPSVRIVAPA